MKLRDLFIIKLAKKLNGLLSGQTVPEKSISILAKWQDQEKYSPAKNRTYPHCVAYFHLLKQVYLPDITIVRHAYLLLHAAANNGQYNTYKIFFFLPSKTPSSTCKFLTVIVKLKLYLQKIWYRLRWKATLHIIWRRTNKKLIMNESYISVCELENANFWHRNFFSQCYKKVNRINDVDGGRHLKRNAKPFYQLFGLRFLWFTLWLCYWAYMLCVCLNPACFSDEETLLPYPWIFYYPKYTKACLSRDFTQLIIMFDISPITARLIRWICVGHTIFMQFISKACCEYVRNTNRKVHTHKKTCFRLINSLSNEKVVVDIFYTKQCTPGHCLGSSTNFIKKVCKPGSLLYFL